MGKFCDGIDIEATCRRIAAYIKDSGLTDRELGEMLGTSVQSVNKWRHAHNLPDIDNMFMMSRIFGVMMDDMIVSRDQMVEKFDEFETKSLRKLRLAQYIKWLWELFTPGEKADSSGLSGKAGDDGGDGIQVGFI